MAAASLSRAATAGMQAAERLEMGETRALTRRPVAEAAEPPEARVVRMRESKPSQGVCSALNAKPDDVASVVCSGANLCVTDSSGVPSCLAVDGQACSKDGDCASGHCRTYFFDGDRDGYGSAASSIQRCNATIAPPAGYVSVGGDCCDYDSGANPGVAATSYFAAADDCGNWDWNCSGVVEKQPQVGPCIGVAAGSTPSCGQDCNRSFFGHPSKVYTQACH